MEPGAVGAAATVPELMAAETRGELGLCTLMEFATKRAVSDCVQTG